MRWVRVLTERRDYPPLATINLDRIHFRFNLTEQSYASISEFCEFPDGLASLGVID
jgi:hypothetical protein